MSEKKNILHIAYSGFGGQSIMALSLPEADVNMEFVHDFMFYGVEDVHELHLERIRSGNFIRKTFSIKKEKGLDVNSLRKLYARLKKLNPDVVICHMPVLWPVFLLYTLRKSLQLLFVEHHAMNLKGKLDFLHSKIIIRLANYVVCTSPRYKREFIESLNTKRKALLEKVVVVQNAVNEKDFFSNRPSEFAEPITIAMTTRFTNGKDHATVIRAIERLKEAGVQFTLFLPGDGETLEECKKLAKKLKVDQQIKFPGMIGSKDVIAILQKTDIFIMSSAGESQSLTILQAMACELTIVASNVTGINELVINEENGLLFEYGNEKDLAGQLLFLLSSPSLANKLSNNGLRLFNENHSYSKYFASYKKLIGA